MKTDKDKYKDKYKSQAGTNNGDLLQKESMQRADVWEITTIDSIIVAGLFMRSFNWAAGGRRIKSYRSEFTTPEWASVQRRNLCDILRTVARWISQAAKKWFDRFFRLRFYTMIF